MEQDILGHLIQIENDAATILFDAQVEADKRTSEAHVQADIDYKQEFEKLISKLEVESKEKIDLLDKEHENSLVEFKDSLHNTEKDINSFNSYMETLLFGE